MDEFTTVLDAPDGEDVNTGQNIRLDGLHAKTVVLDLAGGRSMVVTGSANLTQQAWSGGVEMNAVLTGPTAACGVHAVLGEGRESLGLDAILQPYTPQHDDGTSDPAIDTSYRLEEFHRDLARQRPELVVTEVDENRVEARLSLEIPDDAPGKTRVWLATVPAQVRDLASEHCWEIAPANVTPYLAVETTAGEGDGRVTRRCILMMRLRGDSLDRRRAVLATILSSSTAVLRYLALLLGMDPLQSETAPLDDSVAVTEHLEGAGSAGVGHEPPPIVLFEPLVRAAGRDPKALGSVARQVAELREMPGAEDLIPPEFLQMWDVVLQVLHRKGTP
ncbi:MAG: phospholipase D-like domain-containing protein [Micrococcus sp.]|nr:phospholipase D-like domain-containing protein [Micrococcus sp.]